MTQLVLFGLACFAGWYLNFRSTKFPTMLNFHLWFTGLVGIVISAFALVINKLFGVRW